MRKGNVPLALRTAHSMERDMAGTAFFRGQGSAWEPLFPVSKGCASRLWGVKQKTREGEGMHTQASRGCYMTFQVM